MQSQKDVSRNSPKEAVFLSFLQRAVSGEVLGSLKRYAVRMSAVTQHDQVNNQCATLKTPIFSETDSGRQNEDVL